MGLSLRALYGAVRSAPRQRIPPEDSVRTAMATSATRTRFQPSPTAAHPAASPNPPAPSLPSNMSSSAASHNQPHSLHRPPPLSRKDLLNQLRAVELQQPPPRSRRARTTSPNLTWTPPPLSSSVVQSQLFPPASPVSSQSSHTLRMQQTTPPPECKPCSSLSFPLSPPPFYYPRQQLTAIPRLDPQDSTQPLPFLLAHLSLSNTFDSTTEEPTRLRLPNFKFSSAPPPPASPPSRRPSLPGVGMTRSISELDDHWNTGAGGGREKRAAAPTLHSRTKKIKTLHRYFRSTALLSPPPPASPSTFASTLSPASTRSRMTPIVEERPLVATPTRTVLPDQPVQPADISSREIDKERDKGQPPAWWASVSRSSGQGTASRFAPEESQWRGDGSGWVVGPEAQRQERSMSEEMEAFSEAGLDEDDFMQDLEDLLLLRGENTSVLRYEQRLGQRRHSDGGSVAMQRAKSLSPPGGVNLYKTSTALSDESSSTLLKEQLMTVLRMRLSSAGAPSGAQSGLKFKKLVFSFGLFFIKHGQSRLTSVPDVQMGCLEFLATQNDPGSRFTPQSAAHLVLVSHCPASDCSPAHSGTRAKSPTLFSQNQSR